MYFNNLNLKGTIKLQIHTEKMVQEHSDTIFIYSVHR
jgi:hypothetical protein